VALKVFKANKAKARRVMGAVTYVYIPPVDGKPPEVNSIMPVRVTKTLLNEETGEVTVYLQTIEPEDDEPGGDEEW
jgi:hypothetical protein